MTEEEKKLCFNIMGQIALEYQLFKTATPDRISGHVLALDALFSHYNQIIFEAAMREKQ